MENYKIYPKQFKNDLIPVEKNRCFVLMPFNPDYNIIYGTLKNELTRNGYICNRADEITGSQPIINKIIKEILCSRYVIADLSSYNPNVFYELGIAHCFKDAQNILIIKQKDFKIPFDLTHLTYIEYDINNLMYLTSTIKRFLLDNKYISEFNEALNINGITNCVSENKESFIDYVQDYYQKDLAVITDIINNNTVSYDENKIESFLDSFDNLLKKTLSEKNYEIMPGLLKLYACIISSCYAINSAQQNLELFLRQTLIGYDVPKEIIIQWQTDVVVYIANQGKLLHICLPWIINYFTEPKSTKIDLNRYRIESFLMLSANEEVNQSIATGLFSDNQYVRETMADIIGEKRLLFANEMLLTQLNIEENYFVMRSIIQAISKLQAPNALNSITEWFNSKKEDILSKKYHWIFRHIYTALFRLDKSENKSIAENFRNEYNTFFEEYPV